MAWQRVQPWSRDTYRQPTVMSSHPTVEAAHAELDRITEKLARDHAPEGFLEVYVVDELREPMPRPEAQ